MSSKNKLAIIGCGFIGRTVIKAIEDGKLDYKLVMVFDRKPCSLKVPTTNNFQDVLNSDADIIMESASQEAVFEYAPKILESKDLLILSVGALVDEKFRDKLEKIAKKNNRKIYLPSGAIGSLDALNSAGISWLNEVTLTTIKNPRSFNLSNKKKKILFDGPAIEAIAKFPRNINVAATLSLAGIGFKKTRIKIISDPKVSRNIHHIHAKGDFGEFDFETKNLPSSINPKTSRLAALSAIACLKRISSIVRIV